MKKQNGSGLIKVILYFFVLVIFALTLYACLDIFAIIEVPDKYSIAKWLNENFISTYDIEYSISNETGDGTSTVKKRVVVENKTDDEPITVVLPTNNNLVDYSLEENDYISDEENINFLYYDQLDEEAKIIYKAIEENLDNMKSGTYNIQFGKTFNDLLHEDDGEERLANSFQLAINALNFDNPNLFYIDISKIYLLTKITQKFLGTTYEVEIGASQGQSYLNETFANKDDVEKAINDIEEEKKYVITHIGGSIEKQIKSVHDYLINNLEYDSTLSKANIYNLYGALINKCTVCEGYAKAFKSIMDDLQIPCIIVCGTGINSSNEIESHAWNYVKLDGTWYAIDVTWDDPIIVGNGYVRGDIYYKYYLKGSKDFFKNHTEDGEIVGDAHFKYPSISEKDY